MTDQPMSQEDIDALLAGMSGEPAPASNAVLPTAPPVPAPAAPPGPSMVDQDELDKLLNDLQAGNDSNASPAAEAPAAAPAGGPLGQNDIDAILAGLEEPAAAAPAPAAAAPTGDSPLGQSDIDALLASMAGASEPAPAPAVASAPPAPTGGGPLGQNDIDDLLRNLEGPATSPAPAGSATKIAGSATKTAGSATKTGSASKPASPVGSGEMPVGKLGQDDIDSLLNSLGAEQISVGASKKVKAVPVSSPGTSRGNLALTAEDLTALVTKHAAPAAAGEAAEGMIDQNDIDALVKQLGSVGGPGDAPGGKPSMTEELAKHDAAIDQLLGEQSPASNAVTMDAIDVKGMLDKPGSSANTGRPTSGPVFNVPVLTPPELRGARWLLAAAVLLLGVCAGTLVVVAGALRTLGSELAHERLAALEPGEDYGDDFKAAVARIGAPDEQEAAKGVLFLQRLKKRYPSHEAEIALVLARHFRTQGAWNESAREYASLPDESTADDPRVGLEYADTLRQLHRGDTARRQLYALLANEAHYLEATTPPRPAEVTERNRRTLTEAHLLLGRLLDAGSEPAVASADDSGHGTGGASSEPVSDAHAETAHEAAAPHAAEPAAEGHH